MNRKLKPPKSAQQIKEKQSFLLKDIEKDREKYKNIRNKKQAAGTNKKKYCTVPKIATRS